MIRILLSALGAVALIGPAHAAPPFVAGLERAGTEPIAGAVLVSELGCTSCHASEQQAFVAKPGPDLSAVGARVNAAHLRQFLASPSGVKPGTTMPDVLAHLPEPERDDAANALAHFLATLGRPEKSGLPEPEAVERGAKLYHAVGCVACHSPESNLSGSVPLGPLAEKYTVASLAGFLERPLDVRPGGRMPDCRLERREAADIASYLLRGQKALLPAFAPETALADRGRRLFSEHRCHACHRTGETAVSPVLPALSGLRATEGCLSQERGAWPHYPLAENQRVSLRAAISDAAKDWTPGEHVSLALTRLNCIACHSRDELGGVAANRSEYFTGTDENLGDQGRLPPPLTGVGAKLKERWLREVIANGASARPYLHTRMPKFGAANADALVDALKALDTLPPAEFTRVAPDGKPHQVGRELAGSKGLNCVACHTFREKAAGNILALDLMTMAERLEENWFHHYMAHPQRFSPLTLMPVFWPDGESLLPDLLGGDPGRQRDALWQYLEQGPDAGEPAGFVLEPLLVVVGDEAVIIRRAFPGIGKRGIGVGYPGGINLAFDAEQMRLASVWSGGFIEASGLWRGQGAGQARLLGRDTVTFPPGPAFAVLTEPDTPWPAYDPTPRSRSSSFKGYTLDDRQRPRFRYVADGIAVEDYFRERREASGRVHLERTLRFPDVPPAGLHLRVAAGKSVEARGANEYAVGGSMVVRLPAAGLVRHAADTQELLLPVAGGELKLEYQLNARP
ncbi:MAG: c-type cytochrome [Verrucomicrobiae bacterium]|nr:c-type cytochrome [Verrucomicrobiae bacterium]